MANSENKRKKYSIIDFIKNLTSKKVKWSEYTDLEKKDFSKFMVTRWLSMNYDLIEFINTLQKYVPLLDSEEYYKLYLNVLPTDNIYIQYVKGKNQDTYNSDLIELLGNYFECSREEVEDYLKIFFKTESGLAEIKTIVQKYGKSEKESKKLLTTK